MILDSKYSFPKFGKGGLQDRPTSSFPCSDRAHYLEFEFDSALSINYNFDNLEAFTTVFRENFKHISPDCYDPCRKISF